MSNHNNKKKESNEMDNFKRSDFVLLADLAM